MSLREEFVQMALAQDANVAELCRRFGISRKTGYKWVDRFDRNAREGFRDRSRRPHNSPERTDESMTRMLLDLRKAHPAWGGRKLRRVLLDQGHVGLPAASTISGILKRHGLIDPEESVKHRPWIRFEHERPNDLWQMDFKGWVRMRDGERCYPLTILDDHSRFALMLRACGNEQHDTVKSGLIAAFKRYGQPHRILCDNGGPWGSRQPHESYTRLEIWLLLHGIGLIHGRPYHPQTQGKEERFHRTLNAELLKHRELENLADAQEQFDPFRDCYNMIRPHEALGMQTPVRRYRPSARQYEANPAPPEYDSSDDVRKVGECGTISYRSRAVRVGKGLAGQRVGVHATDRDGDFSVHFGAQELGRFRLKGSEAACGILPLLAALPEAGYRTEEGVTHVLEQV